MSRSGFAARDARRAASAAATMIEPAAMSSSADMTQPIFCRKVMVQNTMGFHLRPIERFTKIASEYQDCEVSVTRSDSADEVANGKSFLSLVGLAAAQGTELEIEVAGPRGDELLERLVAWVDEKFGEEE